MAEEKIQASDLIDKSVLAELQKLDVAITSFTGKITDLMAAMKSFDETAKKGVTTQKQLADNTKFVDDTTKKLSDDEKELEKLQQRHYQTLLKITAAKSEENKKLQEATERLKRENLERKAAIDSNEGLRAKIALLRDQKEKLARTDKDYADKIKNLNKEIDGYQKQIDKTKDSEQNRIGSIGKYKEAWGGITEVISKVVGAFAAVGITMVTFNKLIGTSETLTDRYNAVMKGAETATNAFFASVRDGDWSNLLDNMESAYERGKKYEEKMDSIKKTERANLLILKEKREEYLTLREQAMDQKLTAQQNYDAAVKALNLIKSNYDIQKTLVNKQLDNQAYLLNLKTGENLSDEQKIENTKIIMRAYIDKDKVDKNVRDRAEEINNKLEYQQKLLRLNKLIPIRTESIDKEAKSYQNEIDKLTALTDEYHIYAAVLRIVEQEKSPKAIQDYIDLLNKQAEADSAYLDENKRMIQTKNKAEADIGKESKERIKSQTETEEKESKKSLLNWEKTWKSQEKQKEDDTKKGEEWLKNYLDGENEKRAQTEKFNQYVIDQENKKADEIEKTEQQITDDIIAQKKREAEEFEKNEERKKRAVEKTRQLQIEAVNSLFDLNNTFYETDLQNLEAKQEKEINAIEDKEERGVYSSKVAAKKKEQIENEYARKIARIKTKQAIADKIQSLFNIAIETAQSVMKIGAQLGAYAAPVQAWAIALGAVQAAVVAAQPIPKFFKGVTNFEGGLAWTGEKGVELGETKEGKMFLTPDQATLMALPRGANIYTHERTIEMMGGMQPQSVDKLIAEQRKATEAFQNQKHYEWTPDSLIEINRKTKSRREHLDKYFRC